MARSDLILTSAFLVVLSLTLGLAQHWLGGEPANLFDKPGAQLRAISLVELERLLQKGVVLVDARSEQKFQAGHIPGALNLPATAPAKTFRRPKTTPIVVYCDGPDCQAAETMALKLLAEGYSDVSVLPEGWLGWQAHSQNSVILPR